MSESISLDDDSILDSIMQLIRSYYGLVLYHLPHRNMLTVPLGRCQILHKHRFLLPAWLCKPAQHYQQFLDMDTSDLQ
jgi:hypothetical protein